MKRKTVLTVVSLLALAGALTTGCHERSPVSPPTGSPERKFTIATVVKLDGIAWFNRMREGVERFARETGHDCFQQGPPKADAALQVQIIEDLIAQGVDAICVVPFSVEALEPVLGKARKQGILVVAHEASNLANADLIIEPFDNHAYGAHLMDHLARFMGEQGQFAVFVGSLTSQSHNEWIDGALARQKAEYPKLSLARDRIEEYDDQNTAYQKTLELLKAFPELKGIQGSASTTAAGAGLAVEERGLQNQVSVVGSGLVSQCRQYLESGSVKLISFWDPADAGYVMNRLAVRLLEGRQIGDGEDLGVEGYHALQRDTAKTNLFFGAAWVDVTTNNMAQYNF
ncbi:MAG: autoinducer 2 ABC transporter substrate-binding protein [Verrucomicrobiales bacterium]|nr:autoinducer 2 ABC transporter substrate-binding protein [Verrucomicrobiales bacterium]